MKPLHRIMSLIFLIILMSIDPAASQQSSHISSVETALKSAYARAKGCSNISETFLGWPAGSVEYCEYEQEGSSGKMLPGAVYLLKVPAERIARWIEASCDKNMPGQSDCFRVVLQCGKLNSGYMFAISGNVIENRKNYFFRNGMTVKMPPIENGSSEIVKLDIQKAAALKPNSSITSIPSGLTRYWRTLPRHVSNSYPDASAPKLVDTPAKQQQWLSFGQAEMLAALNRDENRFLDSYMRAHPATLKKILSKENITYADCPGEASP